MSSDILFDNLIITDDLDVASDYAAKTFDLKRRYIDKESVSSHLKWKNVFIYNILLKNPKKKTYFHRLMRHMNYKPGWWALYFLYVSIPIGGYVYYLYRRSKEEVNFNEHSL